MADHNLTLYRPNHGGRGIHNRRWYFCREAVESAEDPLVDLIGSCNCCELFYAVRCTHPPDEQVECSGHQFGIVFTDGACHNNGRRDDNPSAGLGIATGTSKDRQWAIPVDATTHGRAPRTSQRAELLAAIEGVLIWTEEWLDTKPRIPQRDNKKDPYAVVGLIVATDSEYVCKGMYEWYPKWKANGWVGSKGTPSNLDLFHKLDAAVTTLEQYGVEVGFLHLKREYNKTADKLAKEAATRASSLEFSMGSLRLTDN